MIRRVIGIHFSPVGGTAYMTCRLAEAIADILRKNSPVEIMTGSYELLGMGQDTVDLDDETVVIVGMPAYVGKIPLPAARALESFNANGAAAIAAVTFGSKSYGNALYELQHFAEAQGFKVIGAGAFSVRYRKKGILSNTGEYAGDTEALMKFAKAAASKISRLSGSDIEGLKIKPAPLEVDGRLPVHLTSRILPEAAAAAQGFLERVCTRRKASEWYL